MGEVELDFLEYFFKMTEKQTFICLNLKEKREISEDDYSILQIHHRDWFLGVHPLFKTQMEGIQENVTQNLLFGETHDKTTEELPQESTGTEIVNNTVEQ